MPNFKDIKGTISQLETTIAVEEDIDDRKFQNNVNKVSPTYTPQEPQDKPNPVIRGNRKSWPRKPGIARGALEKANYCCENDPSHMTFTSKVTMKNYVEAHHFIPLKLQDEFENSLDVTDNVLSLCPTCHGIFHYATLDEKIEIIKKFYNQRIDTLKKYNLYIPLEKLIEAYK